MDAVLVMEPLDGEPLSPALRRAPLPWRHGEHAVATTRALYNLAIADGIIAPGDKPAHRVAKPRRLPNTRRALTAVELEQINLVARTSGNDVILDALLLRLHTETGCRAAAQLAGWLSPIWATKVLTAGKARSGRSRKMV